MPNGVRRAASSEADQVAAIQVQAWQSLYADLFPGERLEQALLARQWAEAMDRPPHPSAQVLVAVEDDEIVGFAAIGPGEDPDLDPEDGQVYALVVRTDRLRRGHGSRLMAACVEHLTASGYRSIVTWTPLEDQPRRAFWQSAGWGPDSARRTLGLVGEATTDSAEAGTEPEGAPAQATGSVTEVRLVTQVPQTPSP